MSSSETRQEARTAGYEAPTVTFVGTADVASASILVGSV